VSEHENICRVLTNYATGIDRRNWDLFRSCFTEECKIDYGDHGAWAAADDITLFMKKSHSAPSMHRLSNFETEINGKKAWARSYVDALVYAPGSWIAVHSIGYYDDQLVLSSSGWKITQRTYTSVSIRLWGTLGIIPSCIVRWMARTGARNIAARLSTVAN